ncbi:MAG: hypothetical protein ABI234_01300, partial [Ktedonobacteraceae bacterium]
HGPLKKLLGDMILLDAQAGALFFPLLPEPKSDEQVTRIVRRTGKQYINGETRQVHLYHLEPQMPLDILQKRLCAILDFATDQLPERTSPRCLGIALDSDTLNASNQPVGAYTIMCPKPHIGPGVFDLVSGETDCLKNPRLCHAIGLPIVAPFVLRVITQEELERQCQMLRTRGNELLQAAEQTGDEARTERMREQIFTSIGRAVEQYVSLFGTDIKAIEEKFEDWIFGRYWQQDKRSLAVTTRRSLVSGEHIWQNYSTKNTLQDWAAPAIQYCRVLEFELKRRLYEPCPRAYTHLPSGFTLGTIPYTFEHRNTEERSRKNWQVLLSQVSGLPSDVEEFEKIAARMCQENIRQKRNLLAHGGTITKETATSLHDIVVGKDSANPGILRWLAEHLDPTYLNLAQTSGSMLPQKGDCRKEG